QWVCMGGIFPGGKFPDGGGEYNVMWDTSASVRAINDWPTPVVFSGFEIGNRVKVGSRLRGTPEANPVRAAYQHYNQLQDREAWDQTAVLYAVRGARDYWTLSEPGLCLMHARVTHGYNEWVPSPGMRHRYLVEAMAPAALGKVIEDLMIEPPRGKTGGGTVGAQGAGTGSRLKAQGSRLRAQGSRLRAHGSGLTAQGSGVRGQGSGYVAAGPVRHDAEGTGRC
ncbi:MAG: hypothetical protein KBA95_11405, partial [Acidobacteria bacterium]|nr:hypothetical protein [Acidobacteriota bacterium]